MLSCLTLISIPLIVSLLWLYTLTKTPPPPKALTNQQITLLIAHPDDEAMFFAPTLLALTNPALNNTVSILCLSSGNADGQGQTRKGELLRSALSLGVSSAEDVTTVEHPNLQDDMSASWPSSAVAAQIRAHHCGHPATVIVTFDESGVSGHPNHVSLLRGAKEYVSTVAPHARLYTLTSVPILRKYISILDGVVTLAVHGGGGSGLVFVSSVGAYRRAQRAMTDAHVSQMRWFRWGWIALSRYMVVNDLVLRE